eukprot:c24998_g1_i2 orf=391-1965(+)
MAMASIPTSYLLLGSLFLILVALQKVLVVFLWTPLRIQRALRAQGIRGPPFHVFRGNISEFAALKAAACASPLSHNTHNISQRIFPHFAAWSAQYGNNFLYFMGNKPRLVLSDPDLCKEVLSDKLGHFTKGEAARPDLLDLLANGLVTLEGDKWAQHRRMVNPAFHVEKLKAMTPTFINLAKSMLDTWELKLQSTKNQVEIDASEEFKTLTADIISHTAFSSSYAEGKQVFQLQYEQLKVFVKLLNSIYIPGSRFLPTTMNRHRWRLSKQIETILDGIIRKRLDSTEVDSNDALGDDLLGLMLSSFKAGLQGSQPNLKLSLQDVINECKTFFFAGHETTSALLTWTVMLLSIYPEWQERAREEVINIFGLSEPDAEALNQMKVVGMILYETLRLYPPVVAILREPPRSIKLGDILIPGGTSLMIPILPLQVDPTLWGPDAQDFNPQRFGNGVVKACNHPIAFLPFSTGPRNCVGQNFALIEAKIILCMLLQRFRFRLSPGYKHSPTSSITMQPEHGMQIIVEPR